MNGVPPRGGLLPPRRFLPALRLALGSAVLAAQPATVSPGGDPQLEVPVRVQLSSSAMAFDVTSVYVIPEAKRLDGPPGAEQPRLIEAGGAGPWVIRLPVGSRWAIGARAAGVWVRGREITVRYREGPPVVLSVWPLSSLSGSLQVAGRPREMPREVVLATLGSTPSWEAFDPPSFEIRCPVDAKGKWFCFVPVGRYDLRLSAEGFKPVDLLDYQASHFGGLNLGRVRLVREGT